MSKKLWGDPENFRPERFLDAEGKFQKPEHVTPFGIGKAVHFNCGNKLKKYLQVNFT